MTERPILFSGPMVRAILAGKKTQTRRPVKPQPFRNHGLQPMWGTSPDGVAFGEPWLWREVGPDYPDAADDDRRCPYGAPGDRLWVRETFSPERRNVYPCPPAWYRADLADDEVRRHGDDEPCDAGLDCLHGIRFKPGIHMPRRLSRLTLEVTGVRVARLDAITEEDARAEGMAFDGRWWLGGTHHIKGTPRCLATAREALLDRWDGMYGGGDYERDANPWVWVVEFRRLP